MGQDQDRNFTGINFGFDKEKFFAEYSPVTRPVGNFREEFEIRAKDLFGKRKRLILGLSSGLDSQAVLHSFYTQNLRIETAFLYHPGYNDIEFEQLKIIDKKYNIKTQVIEIDPMAVKDQVLELHQQLNLPPNQILHRMFLEKLPPDADVIQGYPGPDFLLYKEKWYWLETANSWDVSRMRALMSLEGRQGTIIGFERTNEILLSLLTDEVVTSYLYSFNYINNNKLIFESGEKIGNAYMWDLYIKPFIYGKYWKDELEYFPKYQGPENIDYIMNGPRNEYEKNLVVVPYLKLIEYLRTPGSEPWRCYQYN